MFTLNINQPSVKFSPNAWMFLDAEKVSTYINHVMNHMIDYELPKDELVKALNLKLQKDFSPFCVVSYEDMQDMMGRPIGFQIMVDYTLDPPSRSYH